MITMDIFKCIPEGANRIATEKYRQTFTGVC